MAKYAIHTKWSWPDGVPSAESMQDAHRELKSKTKAEDIKIGRASCRERV